MSFRRIVVKLPDIIQAFQLHLRGMSRLASVSKIFFFLPALVFHFLKSLQAIDTLKKLQMIRATLPKNVVEVQANAHNLLSETQDSGVFPKLQIEPVMVQFSYDKNEHAGDCRLWLCFGIYFFLCMSYLKSSCIVAMLKY